MKYFNPKDENNNHTYKGFEEYIEDNFENTMDFDEKNISEESPQQPQIKMGTYLFFSLVFVLCLIVFGVGSSYAYFKVGIEGSGTANTTATSNIGCFSILPGSSTAGSAYPFPVIDEVGEANGTYTVTIKNNCTGSNDEAIKYNLILTTLPAADTNIPNSSMKTTIKKNGAVLDTKQRVKLDTLTAHTPSKSVKESIKTQDATLENGIYYLVETSTVAPGATNTYTFNFWLDYGTTVDNSTAGKAFKAIVTAEINP